MQAVVWPRLLLSGLLAGPALAAADPATQPAGEARLHAAMSAHFVRAKQMQAALIRGDLSAAREAADQLLEPEQLAGPSRLPRAHLERLEAAAERAAQAPDLAAAAAAAGAIAQACGSCHSASGARLTFESSFFTPLGSQTAEHMLRHQLAADRMWEGLIGRSEAAWQSGARLLDRVALPSAAREPDTARAERLEALVQSTYRLGVQARSSSDWAERAKLYARLLAACSDCHALAGIQVR